MEVCAACAPIRLYQKHVLCRHNIKTHIDASERVWMRQGPQREERSKKKRKRTLFGEKYKDTSWPPNTRARMARRADRQGALRILYLVILRRWRVLYRSSSSSKSRDVREQRNLHRVPRRDVGRRRPRVKVMTRVFACSH